MKEKHGKYKRYEKYDVSCGLKSSHQYCGRYKGSPCCFFCKDKQKCVQACRNDPTRCRNSICKAKEKAAENGNSQR